MRFNRAPTRKADLYEIELFGAALVTTALLFTSIGMGGDRPGGTEANDVALKGGTVIDETGKRFAPSGETPDDFIARRTAFREEHLRAANTPGAR